MAKLNVCNVSYVIGVFLLCAAIITLHVTVQYQNIEDMDALPLVSTIVAMVGGLLIALLGYIMLSKMKKRKNRLGLMEMGLIVTGLLMFVFTLVTMLSDLSMEEDLPMWLLDVKKYGNISLASAAALFALMSLFV